MNEDIAKSKDSLKFTFKLNGDYVFEKQLNAKNRWNEANKSFQFKFQSRNEWDTVTVEQLGNDIIGFTEFKFTCDNGKSVDFVKSNDCSTNSFWLGEETDQTSSTYCYDKMSQTKTGTLEIGNYYYLLLM